MSLTFPLALSAFADLIGVSQVKWGMKDNRELSGMGSGQILEADLAPMLWQGDVTLSEMYHADARKIEAKLNAVIRSAGSFYLLSPLINGAGATSSTVSKVYASNNFSAWRLRNIGLAGSAGGIGMQVIGHAAVLIGLFDFGGTGRNQHARVEQSGVLQAEGNFSISSGAGQQAFDAIHADIAFQGRTITISANITMGTFASARNAGYFQLWGGTFSLGAFTVTGKRYACVGNGVLETGGVATYVPGTTDGSVASGGQYI